MGILSRLVVVIVLNGAGLLAAAYFIPGFVLRTDIGNILTIAIILTVLNMVIKPILRLILGPVVILTLGLGLIIVNSIILYILDILFLNLSIQTIPALIYASLLFGIVNLVFHKATRR